MLKRILSSLGLSAIIYAVITIGQIIAVPLLLRAWGDGLYGEWLALTNLVASLNLLNVGVQTHVLNLLIGNYVRDEIEKGERTLHAALRLYALLCGLALLVTLFLAFAPWLASFLNIRALPAAHMRIIVLIQGLLASYTILEGLLMSLLIVIKQMPRRLVYSLVERVVFIGVPILVASLGGFPLSVSMILAIIMVGIAITQILDVRRRSPFSLGLQAGTWKDSFALLPPSLTFLAVTLSYQLLTTGVVVVISARIGPAAVALYATTLMLTNFVRSLTFQGLNVLWPEITSDSVQGAKNLFFWYRLSLKLMGAFVIVMALILYLLGPEILAYWTQGGIDADATLNGILVLYLLVHAPELVARIFGLATNRQAQIFKVEFSATLLALMLSLMLIPAFSLHGVAWALVIAQTLGSGVMLLLALRWTRGSWVTWTRDVVIRGLPAALWALLASVFVALFVSDVWWKVAFAVLFAAICIIMVWVFWFSEEEKELLLKNGQRLIISFSNKIFSQKTINGIL